MRRRRSVIVLAALALLVALVAIPALAASPSPSAGPAATKAPVDPSASKAPAQKPEKAPHGPKVKADKPEEVAVTLSGTVGITTDAGGDSAYTLTSGGKTYTLEAGPPWFFGDSYPLKPFVGKVVTVTGEQAAGTTEVDVLTVDGTVIREPGRPPWAGGWKAVGPRHPGWSQEKADRFKAKFGDCFPPGQCKDKTKTPDADEAPAPTP